MAGCPSSAPVDQTPVNVCNRDFIVNHQRICNAPIIRNQPGKSPGIVDYEGTLNGRKTSILMLAAGR
jgi:hypothetical protein